MASEGIVQTVQYNCETERRFTFEQKPWAGLVAGARFLANINETSYFFAMTDAVDGGQHEKNYQRYLKTPAGSAFDAEGVNFYDVLADWGALRRMPEGSLGRAYLAFMEQEEFEMDGLMAAELKANASTLNIGPSRRRYMESGIALHDIYHVLTSYNRQPIGEACVLAFSAEQFSLRGVGLTAHGIGLREQLARPGTPILAMLNEARRLAQETIWLAEVDWRDELARPIDDVRARIGLKRPHLYLQYFESAMSLKPTPEKLPDAA